MTNLEVIENVREMIDRINDVTLYESNPNLFRLTDVLIYLKANLISLKVELAEEEGSSKTAPWRANQIIMEDETTTVEEEIDQLWNRSGVDRGKITQIESSFTNIKTRIKALEERTGGQAQRIHDIESRLGNCLGREV